MAPAKKSRAKTNQPATANLPVTSATPTTQPAATTSPGPAEGSAPGPGAGDPSAYSGTPAVDAGDTVARNAGDAKNPAPPPRVRINSVAQLAADEDNPDAPAQHVLVVGRVDGTEHREDGVLVVALPEARWVPLSALATD